MVVSYYRATGLVPLSYMEAQLAGGCCDDLYFCSVYFSSLWWWGDGAPNRKPGLARKGVNRHQPDATNPSYHRNKDKYVLQSTNSVRA